MTLPSPLLSSESLLSSLSKRLHNFIIIISDVLRPLLLLLLPLLLHLLVGNSLRLRHTFQQNKRHLLLTRILLQLLPNQLLDSLVILHVVLRYETDRMSRATGTCRSSHAMNVVLSVARNVEVQHKVHVGNIETARCDVRGDEDVARALSELVQRAQTLLLRHLSMETDCFEAEVAKHQRQTLSGGACGDEDDDGLPAEFVQDEGQVAVLILGGDKHILHVKRRNEKHLLNERTHSLVLGRYLDLHRILQRCTLELRHFLCHRGGEQIRATLSRKDFHNLVDLLLEVHSQHSVCLIENQEFRVTKREALQITSSKRCLLSCSPSDPQVVRELQ